MSLAFRIGRVRMGDRFAYCVMAGKLRISRAVATTAEARDLECAIRREHAAATPATTNRPCMCCGGVVTSAGPHERLCKTCRPKSQPRAV